jgi:hypothetical protein
LIALEYLQRARVLDDKASYIEYYAGKIATLMNQVTDEEVKSLIRSKIADLIGLEGTVDNLKTIVQKGYDSKDPDRILWALRLQLLLDGSTVTLEATEATLSQIDIEVVL